jgi:hypothetical protein
MDEKKVSEKSFAFNQMVQISVAVAFLAVLITVFVVKAFRVADAVDQSPTAVGEELKRRNLARFEQWKIDSRKVMNDTLTLEKERFATLAKVVVLFDFSQPLKPQYDERAKLYAAVKEDVRKAYSGEPFDGVAVQQKYGLMLMKMSDTRLRDAVIGCIEPAQTFYAKLEELNAFTDISAQVAEYKAILKKEAADRAKKELFDTDVFRVTN